MRTVQEHLTACSEEYARRAANPRVGWDVLSASTWADTCRRLAAEVGGMSDAEAVAHLKARREEWASRAEGLPGRGFAPGWFVGMDIHSTMDEIIDPVARERRGWIEISGYCFGADGPLYRRMLGVNHCVATLRRTRGEGDAEWLDRRALWLAAYHDDIPVVRFGAWSDERLQHTGIVGTVASFRGLRHLEERPEDRGIVVLRRAA